MKTFTLLLLVVLSQSVFAKHSVIYVDSQSIEVSQSEIKKEDALDKCDLIYKKELKHCNDRECRIDANDNYNACVNDVERNS